MSFRKEQDNRRDSYRVAILDQREAVLVFRGKQYPAELDDQSAGGFGVVIWAAPDLQHGDMAELRTSSGYYQVRVMRAQPIEGAPVAKCHALRVGLERLGEGMLQDEAQDKLLRRLFQSLDFHRAPATVMTVMVLVLAVTAGMMTFGVRTLVLSYSAHKSTAPPSRVAGDPFRALPPRPAVHAPSTAAIPQSVPWLGDDWEFLWLEAVPENPLDPELVAEIRFAVAVCLDEGVEKGVERELEDENLPDSRAPVVLDQPPGAL